MKAYLKSPASRRFGVFLLIAALCVSALFPLQSVLATEAPDAPPTPDMRVVATLVEDGRYLELGLNFDSKEAGGFQTAAVLLQYDSPILEPAEWDASGTAVPVPTAGNAATAYEDAAILPAKGADMLTGKLAAAVQMGEEENAKGYLFLSAESARTISGLVQAVPSESGEAAAGLPTETAANVPVTSLGKAEAAADYATVVRFKVTAGTELADLILGVDVVPAADNTDLIQSFPLTLNEGAANAVTYLADNRAIGSAGGLTDPNLSFVWIENGMTVNAGTGGGAGDPGDFATIVLYDWDESLLGSIVLPKASDAAVIQAYLDDFAAQRYAGYTEGMTFPADLSAESYVDDGTKPLTNKKGYNFAGWVQVTGDLKDTFTAYANQTAFEADRINLSSLSGNVILKAAYVGNITLDKSVTGGTAAQYSLTNISYGRYGAAAATTGNYSIKLTIQRENAAGNGVTRLRKPALRVQMTPDITGAAAVWSLIYLDNTDVTEVEIVPPKGVKTVSYTVIEAYNVLNWTGAAAKLVGANSSLKLSLSKNTNGIIGSDGFIKFGTVGFINEQGILQNKGLESNWTNYVNAQAFKDAGLTRNGTDITTTVANNTVKPAILAAFLDNGNEPLTYEELQAVINATA